ncbi:MAG: SRPBCC domain-containing protein [Caulobacteraceae bacterium]|nr:SRPBCC domain-containing protein [Caulobacteraceae bacterium]
MQTARIEKRVGVQAPSDRIWDLIVDLPSWDRWNPVETTVEGAIAFGGDLALTEAIEGMGERRAVAKVVEWQPRAQLVWTETRGLWFRSIRYYEIEELEPGACIVANGWIFKGLRGEWHHDKHRPALRAAAERIGEAIKAHAET